MKSIKDELIKLIKSSVAELELGSAGETFYLEVPKREEFGDLSTNIAMQIAKRMRKEPYPVAESIKQKLDGKIKESKIKDDIVKLELTRPGFINFFLSANSFYRTLQEIQDKKSAFGSSKVGKGKKIQIEFVSANPTGPLTIAHGRQAAVGDALANILEFCGYKVKKEYFINDEGNQMDLLGESIRARYLNALGEKEELPENGYKGQYIVGIAKEIEAKYGKKFKDSSVEKSLPFFRDFGCNYILNIIKKDLKEFGAIFDNWTSQSDIRKKGLIENGVKQLEAKGHIYRKDGAVWFKSSAFGDDKDRVIFKSDGEMTYLAADIGYHSQKFARGFEKIINIWGPDHHGYIARLKAAVFALGKPKDSISILLVQLTKLFREGRPVPMSTRMGEMVTLRELMDEVGVDAARFFFLMRHTDSHLDFDLELAKSKSLENPVYYIQYAHARICSILDYAKKTHRPKKKILSLSLLEKKEEINLIKKLSQFQDAVFSCASNLDPCGLTAYLQELAGLFHSFYNKYRVVSDDTPLTQARLLLLDSIRIMISSGLCLIGVSSPKKM